MKVLPLLSGVWGFIFPAGVVLYWATSGAFRILQQGYITRSIYNNDNVDTDVPALIDDDDEEDLSTDDDSEVDSSTEDGMSEREKAWANRRKQKTQKTKQKKNFENGSSRTTPKGTKPKGKNKR